MFTFIAAGIDELDEFNEAPHVVHSDTVALTADSVNADDEEIIFTRAPHKKGNAFS